MSREQIYEESEFEVFNNQIADDECGNKLTKMKCFWSDTQVGFILQNVNYLAGC